MVQKDVAVANLVEKIGGLAIEAQLARDEGLEFEFGVRGGAVQGHHAGEIHGPVGVVDKRLVELEIRTQAVDDLGIGLAVDFQSHRVAFAAIVQLGADGFQQRA